MMLRWGKVKKSRGDGNGKENREIKKQIIRSRRIKKR